MPSGDESYWHKLKTIWGYRKTDPTGEVTLHKFVKTTIEEVLPTKEVKEGWNEGKEAIAKIQDGNIIEGLKEGALGIGVAATKGVYNKTYGRVVPKGVENRVEKLVSGKSNGVKGKNNKDKQKKCTGQKNKGDCAEKLLEDFYKGKGFEPYNIKASDNSQGNGIADLLLQKDGGLVFVESKGTIKGSNHIPLSTLQKKGGEKYTRGRIDAVKQALDGKPSGPWKSMDKVKLKRELKKLEKELEGAKSITYKKCRVWVKDDPTNCYNQAKPKDSKGGNKGKCEMHPTKKPKCEDWLPPKKKQ